ncbi:unnamed protein product [Dovyalis caffra]|uniref:Response regulatory domain-containing protein n=1 Tax=Dovyalis caffra TaxID=77055 RepID=A0AAV1RKA2_9ROSI|nr:unnamed protein product [Dovyalis caffra]
MASNQSFDTQNSSYDRNLELVVVTVKSPFDALSTLRLRKGVFDLVVTDLHMPEMNGMELQKQVDEEFKLPVIIMSSDDSENVILRSLEGGAAFYIVKPINKDDLKSVWQYAVATKTGNPPSIKEIGGTQEPSSSTLVEKIPSEDVNSATSMNGENKAVPKRILEFMSVPGLSRENVASHLQKYRIFLKKVAERGARSSKNLSVRALRSTFASSQPSLMFKNFQQEYSNFPRQLQLSRGFGAFGGANFGNIQSPIQQAPSNNSALQPPYGQSPPFGNPTGFQQLIFGNANSGGQANQVRSGQESNGNIGANQASGGSVLNGLTSGTGPMQMYPPQSQARLNLQNFGSPTHKKFGSAGIQASKYRSGVGNIGHFNNSLNASNNYAGIRVTADGQLIGAGQMQLRKNEASNGFGNGANSGLMNWTHNGNMNVASVGVI